ncbi:hypothetical protein [Butyrivibrio sp. INlla16]|uniref:hypothetical protein n=1 Tax=Butyrivibrio sp. INlla16 TaxID=1520807 RepID=UPI000885C408|nr:hypothetical protein [Butyrivibrio sp. INlla16]SDB13420.1 hypothetical protein SAMN02910263_00613 [Butyrivibrio sp. INlla16]
MRSIEEEKQAVIDWLMHPDELGNRSKDIKYTNQFKTNDGMRNKTKCLAVVLCLCLFASMAIGCGSSNSKSNTKAEEITIKEQVLFDRGGMKITAISYETDSILGDGIKLLLENDSDKNLTVYSEELIVNGFMISDRFASEVAAGTKANETMYLSSSELKAVGIESIGKVEVYFLIHDSDDWTGVLMHDFVTIKTSAYKHMDKSADDSGFELFNEGGIRIVGKTVDENSFWGTAILLYIENNSRKNVEISIKEMSINGCVIKKYSVTSVYDGKKAFDDIKITPSDLEENGIAAIEEVELRFHIYEAISHNTIKYTDPITFTAQ